MAYYLESAVKRHATHATFEIPNEADRNSLRHGDFAELIFLGPGAAERMWVEVGVPHFHEGLLYGGRLANTPVDPKALGVRRGEWVRFGPEHVCAIERGVTNAEG